MVSNAALETRSLQLLVRKHYPRLFIDLYLGAGFARLFSQPLTRDGDNRVPERALVHQLTGQNPGFERKYTKLRILAEAVDEPLRTKPVHANYKDV